MAKRALRQLKSALDCAVLAGAMPSNPGASVRLAAERKRREDDGRIEIVLQRSDMDEIERIAAEWAVHDRDRLNPKDQPDAQLIAKRRNSWPRYRALIAHLRGTGERIGEALAARWRDFDLDEGIVRIEGTVTKNDGVDKMSGRIGSRVGPPKTAAGRREAAISADAVSIIRAWRDQQRDQSPTAKLNNVVRLKAELGTNTAVARFLGISEAAVRKTLAKADPDARPIDDGDLFAFGTNGGASWMLSSNFWDDAWTPLMHAAGLVDEDGEMPGPHDIRHHFASVAIGAGVAMEDLTAQLGHESIDVTLRHYHHLLGDKRERAKRMSSLIDDHVRKSREADDKPKRKKPRKLQRGA